MSEDDTTLTSGNAATEHDSGQDSAETEPSGDSGQDGASDRGQGAGGDGETPSKTSPPPDKSIADDDDSALIKALSTGDMDSIDDDGKPKKPAADKPEKKTDISATDAESADPEKATDEAAKPSDTDKDKAKEPAKLSDADHAEISKAPKQYRKELTKLFEERHALRDEIEKTKENVKELEPVKQFTDSLIKHATEAGLVDNRDGKIDASALRDLIEQERMLKGRSPKEIAAYYRGIADDLDPDSMPVSLPQDLKDLVELDSLKEEEALVIARKREALAKQPELEKRRQASLALQKTEHEKLAQTQAVNKARETGYSEITGLAKEYQTRLGVDWDSVGQAVKAKLQPLLDKTDPSAWRELAKTVIEAEVAKRKAPPRKPSTTPAPTSRPGKIGSEVMSEEDEIKALSSGKQLA